MQIKKVGIKNLYGLHNYEIHFDEQACIKIIHAPNGYGKTTLLKLIENMLSYKLEELYAIPFYSFYIYFDNELKLEVVKKEDKEQKEKIFYIVHKTGHKTEYEGKVPIESKLANLLAEIKQEMPIRFISANRLQQVARDIHIPAILIYAKELSERIKDILGEAARLGQEVDRTFPVRLIAYMHQVEALVLNEESIQLELQQLEERRSELEKIGLLAAGAPIQNISNLKELDSHISKVLTLYIQDSKKKLTVFDKIAPRMQAMQTIINKRFAYKTMKLTQEAGFIFEIHNKQYLTADKLSSGEQNELILIFELLFKTQVNELILIDEPEISLHIAWQQSFLEDMEIIAALTGVKLMIATHSPDIINGRWDLTTGLEEC